MKAPRVVLATAFFAVACVPGAREFGDSQSADGGGHDAPTVSPRGDAGESPSAGGDASATESDDETTDGDATESASESAADASVGSTADESTTGVVTGTGLTSDDGETTLASGSSSGSTDTGVVDTSAVGTSSELSHSTSETQGTWSGAHSDATSAESSSAVGTSSAPWGTADTASEPITGSTSGEDTGTGPECQSAMDCAPAPNYCHGVECTEGKCDYPHIREGEACGASGVCSEDRCFDGECKPASINEGLYCGDSNAFCMVSGSCHVGNCATSSACTHTVSGSYVEDNSYGYSSGSTAYFLGTNYEKMYVTGTLREAASLTFRIHLPAYNPAATCGGQPDSVSAVIWIYINGSRVASPGNWQLAEATWIVSGPWSLPAGAFEVELYAGEGDGCGWPADTMPIYVSDFEFGPAAP